MTLAYVQTSIIPRRCMSEEVLLVENIKIDDTSSGKRISMQSAVNNPDFVINYFNDHVVYERDLENLIKSLLLSNFPL